MPDPFDTVAAQFDEADRFVKLIASSGALLKKARDELAQTRATLEALKPAQHPAVRIQIGSALKLEREQYDSPVAPLTMIERQIARINTLLGDRPNV